MQMDSSNEKYKTAYNKLVDKIKSDSDRSFSSYSGDKNGKHYRGDETGAPRWAAIPASTGVARWLPATLL